MEEDVICIRHVVQAFGKMKMSVYSYIVDGVMIDTGPPKTVNTTLRVIEKNPIQAVLLTHHHEDHTGASCELTKVGIQQWIHSLGLQICAKPPRLPFYRKFFWGKRHSFQALPLENSYSTQHYTFEVIHTPGHAFDHCCFYVSEKKWLFSGDLYVTPRPKSIFSFENIPEQIKSIQKALTYDFDILFCQHAGVLYNGRERLEEKLRYLLQVQEEVLLKKEQGLSEKEITSTLFPYRNLMNRTSLGEYSPKYIVRTILADASPKK